ncbi:MAG: TIGR02452 family protein [Chlamydiales bacterium]
MMTVGAISSENLGVSGLSDSSKQTPLPLSKRLEGVVQKVLNCLYSKWALIGAVGCLVGACFGAAVGLGVALTGVLIALMLDRNRKKKAVPVVPMEFVLPNGQAGSPEYNKAIFMQTMEAIQKGKGIDPELYQQSLDGARVSLGEELAGEAPAAPAQTKFLFEPITTFAMLQRLVNEGRRPLVLDMANGAVPGGAVLGGSNAQEETLCRQSTLYPALKKLNYPLPEFGGAFVPHVQFFRDDAYKGIRPLVVDVFASAAYDCNLSHKPGSLGLGYNRPVDEEAYRNGMKGKIRAMLRTAIANGNRALVLSGWGCGAYENDTNVVANLYRDVFMELEFNGAFDVVAFGIYRPEDPNDWEIFQWCFNRPSWSKEPRYLL